MWALWCESDPDWVRHTSLRWALCCEVIRAWLAHITLATSALWWQLEPAGSLLPLVMRVLWHQALTAGLPKFSDTFSVVRGHSYQISIPMGMWASCSEVPMAGLLSFMTWARFCEFTVAWIP